jgi:dihydrodipicolinate synthase/N-acetylneuraminate lyase
LPPYYFKPAAAEGLKRFFESVLEATHHPVILYHIPKYAVPEEVVEGLPVWGVKDSGGEPGYAEAVPRSGKGVLIGTEDDLCQRLNLGAQGVISALANFIPEEILEMSRRVDEGSSGLRPRARSLRLALDGGLLRTAICAVATRSSRRRPGAPDRGAGTPAGRCRLRYGP